MSNNRSIMEFFGKPPPRPAQLATSYPASNSQIVSSKTNNFMPNTKSTTHRMGQSKSKLETTPVPENATHSQYKGSDEHQAEESHNTSPESLHNSDNLSSALEIVNDKSASVNHLAQPIKTPSDLSNPRVIKSSDDEEDDSDSDIEDINVLLAARKPPSSSVAKPRPRTPPHQVQLNVNFHKSPLTVLSKSKFDMNALLSHARKDEALEASSKRMKALIGAEQERTNEKYATEDAAKMEQLAKSALLKSVIDEDEEGGMAKITRALLRTEATVTESRFYFIDIRSKSTEAHVPPFPSGPGIKGWEKELGDQFMREQNFVSGFIEDMVILGNRLPDVIVAWILQATCLAAQSTLRMSYIQVLRQCTDQLVVLLTPNKIQRLFQLIGATDAAISLQMKIVPTGKTSNPYTKRDFGRLFSLVQLLGKVGPSLDRQSRVTVVSTFLRMTADHDLVDNVELLRVVQKAIAKIVNSYPENEWKIDCITITKSLFETIEQPSLRYQIVDALPSTSIRMHDIKRRLAMCFFFDDIAYSLQSPHERIDLGKVIDRLEDKDFDARPTTDYPELRALIRLLDVAVDDGRSELLDYKDAEVERIFNKDVDDLVLTIKDIMTSIGNPGAAFISRIEAKETLELVSQRIADTVRTKRKPKENWFNKNVTRDKWASEKKGIDRFVVKKE